MKKLYSEDIPEWMMEKSVDDYALVTLGNGGSYQKNEDLYDITDNPYKAGDSTAKKILQEQIFLHRPV